MESLNKELNRIQQELNAPKSQKNEFAKYNYRSAEDILTAVKPLLKGLTLTLKDEIVVLGEGTQRFYTKAIATLSDGKESLEITAYAREEESKKGMDGSQITGASSSYARKYALNGMFAIDDTKDSDATNDHKEKKEDKKAKPVKTVNDDLDL